MWRQCYFKRTLWEYLMAIHQTKCASICDCYQIAKLNVCQMYHVLLRYVNYVCTMWLVGLGIHRQKNLVYIRMLFVFHLYHLYSIRFRSSFAIKFKSKVNLKHLLWSTVKLLYLFDVLGQIGQGQTKILARQYRIIQFNNKKFQSKFRSQMKIGTITIVVFNTYMHHYRGMCS